MKNRRNVSPRSQHSTALLRRRLLPRYVVSVILATLLLAMWKQPAAIQNDPAAEFVQLINRTRLNTGLPPLGASSLLTQAAQRHVKDIVKRGTATHEGSDGSTYQQRIREAGYRAWNDGLLVNEAFWLGLGGPSDALNWFRNRPEEWALFSDPRYREMGVGYAEDGQGVHYFVITFGSRPGVLPTFINESTKITDSPIVAVRLSNEDAEPMGEGSWIGKAIEVKLSNTPNFDDAPWQPWEPLLPWLLAGTEPGDYAVYVQFRDGANRTAVAEATIQLVAPGEAPPAPTPLPEAVLQTPLPTTATTTPTDPQPITGTVTAIPTAQTPAVPTLPPDALEPLPTWTPLPDLEALPQETKPVDWPLIAAFVLQGIALLLGVAVFLRRRS
jgi:uncharacterized protein YkwD